MSIQCFKNSNSQESEARQLEQASESSELAAPWERNVVNGFICASGPAQPIELANSSQKPVQCKQEEEQTNTEDQLTPSNGTARWALATFGSGDGGRGSSLASLLIQVANWLFDLFAYYLLPVSSQDVASSSSSPLPLATGEEDLLRKQHNESQTALQMNNTKKMVDYSIVNDSNWNKSNKQQQKLIKETDSGQAKIANIEMNQTQPQVASANDNKLTTGSAATKTISNEPLQPEAKECRADATTASIKKQADELGQSLLNEVFNYLADKVMPLVEVKHQVESVGEQIELSTSKQEMQCNSKTQEEPNKFKMQTSETNNNNNNEPITDANLSKKVQTPSELQVKTTIDETSSEFDYTEALAARRQLELAKAGRDADEAEELLYLRNSSPYSSPGDSSNSLTSSPYIDHSLGGAENEEGDQAACANEQLAETRQDAGTPVLLTAATSNADLQSKVATDGQQQQQQLVIANDQTSTHEAPNCVELFDQTSDSIAGRPVQASEANLRQLKASAREDIQVCVDQGKQSTEAARRLFNALVNGDTTSCRKLRKARQKAHFISSSESATSNSTEDDDDEDDDEDEDDDDGIGSSGCGVSTTTSKHSSTTTTPEERDFDSGSIRLGPRGANGSPSSSSPVINFRRTLVCSVSPTPTGYDTLAANQQQDYAPFCDDEDEEMRQCRAAFRTNRRLIECAQVEANQSFASINKMSSVSCASTWNLATLKRNFSSQASGASNQVSDLESQQQQQQRQQSNISSSVRELWSQTIGSRALTNCSRCQQRLYPVDKMKLDFTRAKLNIHKHCFRCHVCSTLLRLETYAAVDSKLYCPAHIKTILPTSW